MRIVLLLSILSVASHAKDIWDEAVSAPMSSSVAVISSSALPVQAPNSVLALSSSSLGISSSIVGSSIVAGSSTLGSSSSQALLLSSSSAILDSLLSSSSLVSDSLSDSLAPPAITDRGPPASISSSSSAQSSSSSTIRSRKELLGPVKVSRVHGIDEMKGRYKSPRKALFMSLALPGAGQMYVGGSAFNYARGGLYLITEAVLGGLWYHYSVTLYDRQVKKYEKFANQHYSIGRYESEMYKLYTQLADEEKRTEFQSQYLGGRESYCGAIYKNSAQNKCSEQDLRKGDNHRLQFPEDETLGESVRKNDFHDETELYQTIGTVNYVYGWDDATDYASANDLILETGASEWVALAKSENHDEYLDLRDRANTLAGYQAYFLGGIILNHLVSAVDATWSAYVHNKGLYEEKLSWYERIRLDSQVKWGADIGTQVTARLEF